MMNILRAMDKPIVLLLLLLISISLDSCTTDKSRMVKKRKSAPDDYIKRPGIPPSCSPSLKFGGSDCSASQKKMARVFHEAFRQYGVESQHVEITGEPPALGVLPKDRFGLVNWTKAAMDGIILPKDSLGGGKVKNEDFFELYVLLPVDVQIMADVVFPHNIHTYWLSCNNCHPKIFKPEVGSNPVTMTAIEQGEYCGKCHGKVAFPFDADYNISCRRCHFFRKKN